MSMSKLNIAEIVKKGTEIKNVSGVDAAILYYITFLDSNSLDFDSLIKCLKRLAVFMTKSKKYTVETAITTCNQYLLNYPEYNHLDNVLVVADIYGRIDIYISIEYLNKQVAAINIQTENDERYFNLYLEISSAYIQLKVADKAIIANRCAQMIAFNALKGFFLCKAIKEVNYQMSRICLVAFKTPHYEEYIMFSLTSFVLEVLTDIKCEDNLGMYNRTREAYLNGGHSFYNEGEILQIVKNLGKEMEFKTLLDEVLYYTFNQLVIDADFPKPLLEEIDLNKTNGNSKGNDFNFQLFEIGRVYTNFNNCGIAEAIAFVSKVCAKHLA